MIHILNYCLFTVVVFAVLLRFFWQAWYHRDLSDDVSRLLKGFSVIDSSLKYDQFRNLKNKIYPLLYQNIE